MTTEAVPRRPNLFEFATSELSQDAVICWLLAWASSKSVDDASPGNVARAADEPLRQMARALAPFLDLLDEAGMEPIDRLSH